MGGGGELACEEYLFVKVISHEKTELNSSVN